MGTAVALGVGDGSALAVVGAAVAAGVGTAVALGVGDGSALAVVGAAVAAGVGTAVALGVGDGSALAVVGAAVVCPEDALPSGSLVARSEDGPSGRLIRAAAGQQQQRQNQRQGKDSQEKAWRSHLDSLPLSAGPRWDARRVRILAPVGHCRQRSDFDSGGSVQLGQVQFKQGP